MLTLKALKSLRGPQRKLQSLSTTITAVRSSDTVLTLTELRER